MQQHSSLVANILPPHDPGVVSKGQNSTFSEQGHVAYQIKWNVECSIMVENILPVQNFSEYGHGSYQIKGNDACSNMVANILYTDTPNP